MTIAIHPIPGNDSLIIPCSASIIDRRDVISSNGEAELRYVIETTLAVVAEGPHRLARIG